MAQRKVMKKRITGVNGTFAKLVLRWRMRQKLSQPKAAKLLGVPYRTFQDWEYGNRAPLGLARVLITAKLKEKGTATHD